MKGHYPSGSDQRAPGLPIRAESVISMISVDEDEVHRLAPGRAVRLARVGSGEPDPLHHTVVDPRYLATRNNALCTESQAAHGIGVDGKERPVWRHYVP